MQKTSRIIVAALSDTHGGHKLGLMNPDVTLFDESETGQLLAYQPKPTASQEYLWGLYKEHIWQVQNIAKGDPVVVFHNGDITQGDRFKSELVSTRMADQILIGVANLKPWCEAGMKVLRLAIGTEVHAFGEGSAEILVGDMLRKEYPDADVTVTHHGLCKVNGIMIDYAHHGPGLGSRAWLAGNVARYYLQSLMMNEIMSGNEPPRLVLRGHYHGWISETVTLNYGERDYVSTLIVTPGYCMIGEHARKITRSRPDICNGMVVVEVIGEAVNIHRLTRTLDVRNKEEMR